MGTKNIRFTTTSLVLCFFMILIVLLSSSTAALGRSLSSSPTGSSGNSKIGVVPGHSSTAPSATSQSSPTKQSSSASPRSSRLSQLLPSFTGQAPARAFV